MSLTLVASNVFKSYNGKPVLKDCSFSFDKPGTYILMGPNGSGKSTLLRICALIEKPDSGEVKYHEDTSRKPFTSDASADIRRRITLVLPKVGVFNATVFNNVAYGLKIRRLENKKIRDKVEEALKFVGLHDKYDQNALTLSSGETQRLGIARAIVVEPEILFLDEPTASLDPHSTVMIEEMIHKLKNEDRMTIIMVTHNIFQAQRLADIVLFMYDGRITDHGPSNKFFEKLYDERVYKFITGQMVY
jgi:tungstate transport system ATP-binding protein